MKNLDTLTRELGAALQLAPEYARFVAAKEANEADQALAEQMKQIELIRMQYQHEAQKGDQADSALMEEYSAQFKQLQTAILGNVVMQEYQAAAGALDAIIQHITGIIAGCAQGEDPVSYVPAAKGCGGCGGGCSGGGCGGH
jgi:cell fate (sporulation/competence/biofilm development) regulator YlbF (YheA/YmcA/DUF963 family)